MLAVNEVPLCTIEECDESARASPPGENTNGPAPEINLENGSNRSSLRIPSYYVQSRPQSTLSTAPSLNLNNLTLLPAKVYQPLGTHHHVPSSARPESETISLNSPYGPNIWMDSSSLRGSSYHAQSRPQSTLSLAPSTDLNNLILLPSRAYQPHVTHHDIPSSARPESETSPPVFPPHGLNIPIGTSSLRGPSYYVQSRPQSNLSLAPSLDLSNLILLPAKVYQPPVTHHDVPPSARPESETIPPMSPPHGLNIRIDGENRLSTLSLEDARCILATNPWQKERSHRPLLHHGRLLRSSILATEKPLPPIPPLPSRTPPNDDLSAGSSKQTLNEKIGMNEGSPEWPVKGFPSEWSTQATKSISDERGSLHDIPGTRREITLPEEEPPREKPKLHRSSTIPNWVKGWRRSRAERNRYADSLEALPTCRESHLPKFVQPEHRPPETRPRSFLQVLGGFFIMLNTFGLLQSYGVFQTFYASALMPSEAPSTIATIGSIQMFSLLTTAFAAGLLEDFTTFRPVLFGGCIILVVSMLISSICSLWWHLFLVQGICTGIGMGMVFGSGFANVCSSISKGRYGAVAAASCGAAVGGMIYTAMAEKLLTSSGGYGWAFRAMALISFITLLPAYITLREPEHERRTAKLSIDWTILHDDPFLLLLAGLFFTFLGLFTGFFYLPTLAPLLLHEKGSPSQAASSTLLILANDLTIPSALLILPVVAPHLGALNTLIPTTLLTSFVLFLWTGTTSRAGLVMLTCAYGVCAGAVLSLVLLAIGELMAATTRMPEPYLPASPRRGGPSAQKDGGIWMGVLYAGSEGRTFACRKEARCRLGVLLATVAVASLVGMPLAGTMVEGKVGAQAFAGGCVLFGGVLFVGTRVAKVGWTGVKV